MNEIIIEILALLEKELWGDYKRYFYWSNKAPEEAIFPFIELEPNTTLVENKWTWWLQNNTFWLTLRIKSTTKEHLNVDTNSEILKHIRDLVLKMEDRNNDFTFKPKTILWILSANLQLNWKANIMWDWDIKYDNFILNDSYIYVGEVSFTVMRLNC